MGHYNFVKKHADVLLSPPLSRKILVGEQFAGPWVRNLPKIFMCKDVLMALGHLRVRLELRHVGTHDRGSG